MDRHPKYEPLGVVSTNGRLICGTASQSYRGTFGVVVLVPLVARRGDVDGRQPSLVLAASYNMKLTYNSSCAYAFISCYMLFI